MTSLRRLVLSAAASAAVGVVVWQGCMVYDSSLLVSADGSSTEAGSDAQPETGDGCNHATWPARPLADDDSGTQDIEIDMALSYLDFGTGDGGTAPLEVIGYDLDGVCTCPGNDSCIPFAEAGTQCDEEGGIDDSAGKLLIEFSGPMNFWDQTYINQRIASGEFGAFVRIQNYNGQANDRQVSIALFTSNGTQGAGTDAGYQPAKFDGTDVWTLDPTSLLGGTITDAGPTPIIAYDLNAYVSNYTVVGNISDMPLAIGSATGQGLVTIELTGAHVIMNLKPFGGGLFQGTGVAQGRWETRKLLTSLQVLNDPFQPDAALCGADPIYQLLKTRICNFQDITSSVTDDNKGAPCDAVSLSFGFNAVPAHWGSVFAKPDSGGGCGPTYTDQCGP